MRIDSNYLNINYIYQQKNSSNVSDKNTNSLANDFLDNKNKNITFKISPLDEFINKASLFYKNKAQDVPSNPAKITNYYKSYYYNNSIDKILNVIDIKIPYDELTK